MFTVFYRYQDSVLNVVSFPHAKGGGGLEEWLDSRPGMHDVMAGNGLRDASFGEALQLLLPLNRFPRFPDNSFLVIHGYPVKLVAIMEVVKYRVPS